MKILSVMLYKCNLLKKLSEKSSQRKIGKIRELLWEKKCIRQIKNDQ